VPRGATRAPRAASRASKGEPDEQRRERDRAAEQRVVEHGHLDHEALDAIGGAGGRLERGVGAERRAAQHSLLHVGVVEQRDRLAPECRHRVAGHVGRTLRVAVAEQVQAEHPVAALGQRLGERPMHAPREQQARQQGHHSVARSVLVVDEPVAIELERSGHGGHRRLRI
jgi:hypothetical protein